MSFNNGRNADDDDDDSAGFGCPDISCLWRVPGAVVQNWVSWSAGMVGMNPGNVNIIKEPIHSGGGRQPRYVRLRGTSADAIDNQAVDDDDDDENDDDVNASRSNEKTGLLAKGASSSAAKKSVLPKARAKATNDIDNVDDDGDEDENVINNHSNNYDEDNDSSSRGGGTVFGSHLMCSSALIKVSPEFEVWQKYIRDLSNFAVVDVDTAIVPSSTTRDAVPLLVVTIRGPVIPALGRCRRSLLGTAFIAPATLDEWLEANPVRVMEVVEALLLAVLAPPDLVAGDDTLQSILESGTHILAMPAPHLNQFLQSVSQFVRSNRVQTKVVLRDVDFTAEFDSARKAHADQFLVLDTSTNPPSAREPAASGFVSSVLFRASSSSSSFGGSAGSGNGGGDQGSCPEQARTQFETDFSMLDIVRSVRSFARRVIGSISLLKTIEIRGCLVRDSDLDVSGFLGGRLSLFSIPSPHVTYSSRGGVGAHNSGRQQQQQQQQQRDQNSGGGGDNDDDHHQADRQSNATTERAANQHDQTDGFFTRSGVIAAVPKRLHGPSRLVMEHCGLSDAHISALVRLVRLESERLKRGHFAGTNADAAALHELTHSQQQQQQQQQPLRGTSSNSGIMMITSSSTTTGGGGVLPLAASSLSSLESLRISGQFLPMSVIGLVTAMGDAWEDAEKLWRRKVVAAEEQHHHHCASASDTDIQFPLRELEVPASALHIVRGAIDSRGLSSTVHCKSIE